MTRIHYMTHCIVLVLVTVLIFVQDEEQDPLLNSFSHLKEVLNNIKGRYSEPNLRYTATSHLK